MNTTFATSQGNPNRPNEDYAVISNDVVILLDGAGGPSELDNGCSHGVVWFVRQLGSQLLNRLADSSASLSDALYGALSAVAEAHRGTCDLNHPGTPSATVCVLRWGLGSLDYLVLADSTVLVEETGGLITAVTDRRIEDVASTERAEMFRYPFSAPEHQQHRIAKVRAQQQHRNKAEGFWVAAAQPEAATHALTGSFPLAAVTRAAALSDGAARALEWGLLEHGALLGQAEKQGPTSVIRTVRDAEREDPDGSKWPRSKRTDDATLVLCVAPSR
jgi:hypothetical protein